MEEFGKKKRGAVFSLFFRAPPKDSKEKESMEKKANTSSQGINASLTSTSANSASKIPKEVKTPLALDFPASPQVSSPQLAIEGIYTQNHQLIVHRSPREAVDLSSWAPKIDFQANPRFTDLGSDQYEVILRLHLSAHQNEQAVFEIDLEQVGILTLQAVPQEQRASVLYGVCPNYLFPYAGVLINQMLAQAAFPPVYLAPLDFIALYQQYQQQERGKAEENDAAVTAG